MSYRVYGGLFYKFWLWRKVARQRMRPMAIEKVPNGIVVNEHSHGFGVFDDAFRFVKSSSQVRGNNGQFIPKFAHDNIPYVDADAVFVGNVMPQFGHFLLEHMNRAYAALRPEYRNMKYVLINNDDVNPVPAYMYDLLMGLGVKKENILILNQTTRFRNVFIPRQGYNLPRYSSVEFGATFDEIARNTTAENPTGGAKKIYLSRAKLGSRRTYGEEKVQAIFAKNGFTIVYPETLPLAQQIAAVRDATVLAGCAGTALHLGLFMKPGGTVIQIKRNRVTKDNAPTQQLINETKGLNGIFVNASVESGKTDHCSNAPQVIGVNRNMLRFFDENGFKYDAADVAMDAAAWNEYKMLSADYRRRYGSGFSIFMKHKLVRVSAWFIPGRERRGRWRNWLKGKLNIV